VLPDHPDLILLQAMRYHEKDDFKQAEASYRKVIEIEMRLKNKQAAEYNVGSLSQAYFNLGALLDKQGRFNEAIDQMKKVIELQPQNADAYNYIGYSYADKGIQLDDAKKYMDSALKLDPDNSYYLDSLGWVYYRKGKYQDAKEQFDKALKFLKTEVKDDAVIYDHLGEVLLRLGQKQEAVVQWQKALKLDPDNKTYLDKIQKEKPSDSL
ncbi:MAG TPA: tetratricopeptide repeat protein, partial [bacterium]